MIDVGSFIQHSSAAIVTGICLTIITKQYAELSIMQSIACGSMCTLSNFLPDIDSPSSKPITILRGILSTCITGYLLFILPYKDFTTYFLTAISSYLVLQYVLRYILGYISVHRGMFHSIPAIVIWGCIIYNVSEESGNTFQTSITISAASGYFFHLIVDELYAMIDISGGEFKPKKSAGTALKMISSSLLGTSICYTLLGLILWFTLNNT